MRAFDRLVLLIVGNGDLDGAAALGAVGIRRRELKEGLPYQSLTPASCINTSAARRHRPINQSLWGQVHRGSNRPLQYIIQDPTPTDLFLASGPFDLGHLSKERVEDLGKLSNLLNDFRHILTALHSGKRIQSVDDLLRVLLQG